MLRELPFDIQVSNIKYVITELMQKYQTDTFETIDLASRYVLREINFDKVFNYLADLGEIDIINKGDPVSGLGSDTSTIRAFRVTEKFGSFPGVAINVPVTTLIISGIESELPKMMQAYGLLASLENRLRFFIVSYLEKNKGPNWWDRCISKAVKDNIERNKNHPLTGWHIELPKHDIQYTAFSDLANIIINNWDVFEQVFKNQSHVKTYLESIEIPRNTIAHSNVLSKDMMQELELNSRKILNLIEERYP
jgi:hypothetical protein